jgi:glucokinase
LPDFALVSRRSSLAVSPFSCFHHYDDLTMDLVADIGSTNARFALANVSPGRPPVLTRVASLACAGYPSLAAAIRAYLETVPVEEKPTHATLAVAGPITGDAVKLTNLPWEFSIAEMRKELGLAGLQVINDFTAISYSLPSLPASALAAIGPSHTASAAKSFGVIGPGTGLGVGALLHIHGKYVPVPSEGGHATFAPVTDTEMAIARILHARFGHVSNERLLSGRGLVWIYEALATVAGKPAEDIAPHVVTERALAGTDDLCRETLNLFCAVLGSVAGDLALLLYADAIYIAGGIVPRFIDFLRASTFRQRFEDKGRFAARMAIVPTLVIMEPYPGLIGAAVARQNQ